MTALQMTVRPMMKKVETRESNTTCALLQELVVKAATLLNL